MDVECINWDTLPSSVNCWTTASNSRPLCTEPGSDWKAALVGAVLCVFFAVSLAMTGSYIEKDIIQNPSVAMAGPPEPLRAALAVVMYPIITAPLPDH